MPICYRKNSTQMPVNILVLVSQHEPYRGCCAHQPRPELHERVSQHEPYKGHSAHQSRPPEVHAPASQYKPCRRCCADQSRPLLQLGSTPAQPGQTLNLRLTTKSPALSRHSETQMFYVALFFFPNAHLMQIRSERNRPWARQMFPLHSINYPTASWRFPFS